MMSDLVGQLSANLTQAIVESTIEQYKMLLSEMNDVRQSIVELQHRAFKIPSAQELAQTVSNEIRQSLSPVYGATTTQPGSTASLHDEIIALSHARNGLSAMMKVLEEGNIELFNWALPKINMEDVLEGMNLQLPVMLSLAQQLGYDLHTHTELKLDWLAELFTVMDPKVMTDAQLEDTSSAVFEELFANLRVIFAQTPTASPLHKKIKSVMRLVRMIMAV